MKRYVTGSDTLAIEDVDGTMDMADPPAKKQHLELNAVFHPKCEESPRKKDLKQELNKTQQKVSHLKKKLKVSNQKSKRLKTKVNSLKMVIKNMISSRCEQMLDSTISGVLLEMFKRITSNAGKGNKYSPKLKSFAMTLQLCSSKAYE